MTQLRELYFTDSHLIELLAKLTVLRSSIESKLNAYALRKDDARWKEIYAEGLRAQENLAEIDFTLAHMFELGEKSLPLDVFQRIQELVSGVEDAVAMIREAERQDRKGIPRTITGGDNDLDGDADDDGEGWKNQ